MERCPTCNKKYWFGAPTAFMQTVAPCSPACKDKLVVKATSQFRLWGLDFAVIKRTYDTVYNYLWLLDFDHQADLEDFYIWLYLYHSSSSFQTMKICHKLLRREPDERVEW
jgi:hypothetical protein